MDAPWLVLFPSRSSIYIYLYCVGPTFKEKGCWMIIRSSSELRTGIAWARDVLVSGWNWYSTEEITMLEASAPTQMAIAIRRRVYCASMDHTRVIMGELRQESCAIRLYICHPSPWHIFLHSLGEHDPLLNLRPPRVLTHNHFVETNASILPCSRIGYQPISGTLYIK